MRARLLTIALPLVLAATPELAFAQRSHSGGRGGGHHGGGGGGYAAPRSGGGRHGSLGMRPGGPGPSHGGAVGSARGGTAAYRHPRAGTGSGGYGYYGRSYGGHHGHYGYGYGYRPYYGSYYGGYYSRPWYGPYFYGSIGWGWPEGYGYGAWPYAYAPYSYGPVEQTIVVRGETAPAQELAEADASVGRRATIRGPSGELRLEVRPSDASVYVDDAFRGTADRARILDLAPGRHSVEIVRPGYAVERHEVRILEGERTDLLVELRQP